MDALSAERPVAPSPGQGPVSTPWGSLSWSQTAEMALPGGLIGLLGGMIAGGLAAASGLSLPTVLLSTVSLALPLALGGAAYGVLLAKGRIPLGPLAPAALLWFVAFPVARVLHAAVLDLYAGAAVAVPHGWAAFVVYQVLVSVAFAIGFWWLHENFAPRWWFHLRDRNPVADHFIRVKLEYAVSAHEEQLRQRQRRRQRRRK